MANNRDLKITELDFEAIKKNYKQFLKSQNEFTDYDFDASGMNVILDILAYNTHYNAFYLNSAVNETFLATANSRANIVKSAQSLNYLPKSKTAATTYVDLEITIPESTLINVFGSTNYGVVQLGRNTRFTSTIDNTKYVFVNPEAVTLNQVGTETFTAQRVELRQGIPNTFRYVVDVDDDFQRFIIQNENVDTNTLEVSSQAPNLVDQTRFTYHKQVNLQDIGPSTPIYFIIENAAGLYEVEFGDGNYGYKPVNNEEVFLEYLVTSGKSANGASTFSGSSNIVLSGNEINNATVTITSAERAFGGADRETTESVRFNAPKYFQSQDRAIINNDYAALVRNRFPSIESVNVWGGEQNNPPRFGRVFITAKPYGSLYFTETEKQAISNAISEKMVSAVRPVIVDAKYTFIELSIDVKYDSKRTLKRASDIKNEIVSRILQFSQENLEKFRTEFYTSRFTQLVNETNEAIETNNTTVRLKKEFTPEVNVARSYTFYFQNEIEYPYRGYRGSINSSPFTYSGFDECYINQRPDGKLTIVSQPTGGVETTVVENAGEVDYGTGTIVLNSFVPQSFSGDFVSIYVTPKTGDIRSYREFILRIQEYDISTNMTDVTSETSLTDSLSARSQASDITIDTSSTAF